MFRKMSRNTRNVLIFFVAALLTFLVVATAQADLDTYCDHPRFVEHGCVGGGADGQDGQDGDSAYQVARSNGFEGNESDWLASLVGAQGSQGLRGETGAQGIQGLAGVVSTQWINEVRHTQSKFIHYMAASEAIQMFPPRDQFSSLTFGLSQLSGKAGIGVGYAFRNENGVVFTFGVGSSGGHQVGKTSIGFEFGGKSRMTATDYKAQLECSFVGGVLSGDATCVKDEP